MTLVTLVDEQDNFIGTKDRSSLTNADRWRTAAVWLKNSKGQVLIARRSQRKKLDPGLWAAAAAGTVDHPEDYITTAIREAKEELGVELPDLMIDKTIAHNSSFGKRVCGLAQATIDRDIKDFNIQHEEVSEIKWISEKDLEEDMSKHPEKYVESLRLILEHYSK